MRRLSPLLITVLLAAGCSGSGTASTVTNTVTNTATVTQTTTETTTAPPAKATMKVFFLKGEQLGPVLRPRPDGATALPAALRSLFAGPTAGEKKADVQTVIPKTTRLTSVTIQNGGTAMVEVTKPFTSGLSKLTEAAAKSELEGRLAQVVFTAEQFNDVKKATVTVGGRTIATLTDAAYVKPQKPPPPPVTPPVKPTKPPTTALPTVTDVQTRLVKLKFLPKSGITGTNNYATQQAVMAFQASQGLGRDGVVGPLTAKSLAKAQPIKPLSTGPSRRVEVRNGQGLAIFISGGSVTRILHVSSGAAATPTPPGRYSVFRKELNSWSVPFKVWLPYASYFTGGIAFHEYTPVPAYPASHGCVRVPVPDAKWAYTFLTVGTPVIVLA